MHLVAAAVGAAILAASALALPRLALAQEFPEPRGYVSDFAEVIPPDVESPLEDALRLAEQETTVEIAVVTVKDLGGLDINTYAVKLFERWGVGQKGKDNGLLFITAIAERKVWIEVGYGLEGYITDSRAGRILDQEVLPDFKQDNFALGITRGARALRVALDETGYTTGQPAPADEGFNPEDLGIFQPLADKLWLVIIIGFASIYAAAYMARTKSFWFGGLWGAGVGSVTGWVIAGFGGLILDFILSNAYRYSSSTGRSTTWTGSRGGFGGGIGGMRSGGFGGFGGGRSGGGGAGRGF